MQSGKCATGTVMQDSGELVRVLTYLPLSSGTLNMSSTISQIQIPLKIHKRKHFRPPQWVFFFFEMHSSFFKQNIPSKPYKLKRHRTTGVGDEGHREGEAEPLLFPAWWNWPSLFADPVPPDIKPGESGERASQLFLQLCCWHSSCPCLQRGPE